MSTFAGQINDQINAGRKTIERSFAEMKEMDVSKLPPAALVAAGFTTGVIAVGLIGWMVYRSRRRRTLVQRLQGAIPDSVRELPREMGAHVRRAL